MKNLIISCVILAVILSSLLCYGFYCKSITDELNDFCASDKIYSFSDVKKTEELWLKKELIVHLGVNFSLCDNVSLAFAEHSAALETGDSEEIAKTAETLRFHIERLRDSALVSFESVI